MADDALMLLHCRETQTASVLAPPTPRPTFSHPSPQTSCGDCAPFASPPYATVAAVSGAGTIPTASHTVDTDVRAHDGGREPPAPLAATPGTTK